MDLIPMSDTFRKWRRSSNLEHRSVATVMVYLLFIMTQLMQSFAFGPKFPFASRTTFEKAEYWEKGVPVRFERRLDFVSTREYRYEALYTAAKDAGGEDFDSINDEFVDSMDDMERRLSKDSQESDASAILFGNADFTQFDPRTGQYWQDTEELNLIPIVSFRSGNVFMWGDMGEATLFIPEEDLPKMEFSRVRYYWDCC